MLYFATLLVFATLASARTVIDFNSFADEGFRKSNLKVRSLGLGVKKLEDGFYSDMKLKKGVQIGADTMKRIGDSFLTRFDNGTNLVDVHFGFQRFVYAYDKIQYRNIETSGMFKIGNNSFHLAYSFRLKPECEVNLDIAEFDYLDDIVFETSNPEYENEILEAYKKNVISTVNKRIKKKKDILQKALEYKVCSKFLNQPSSKHVSHALSSLIHLD